MDGVGPPPARPGPPDPRRARAAGRRGRGYTRLYLTTGPLQPEARALYLAAGWTPLFDPAAPRPTELEAMRGLPPADLLYAFETSLGGTP
ncbi:hypothetical protein JKP75_10355 [Blastococcus sp. TML/M2B]|uniref:hypothetical protein n=1 Tax=Blastococcus sp. TML/M2B TaxID=2798727 RepID=UPI00190D86D8|nr:hypothetical protein [Blastococcus sp. TML/M2B]MBN1092928.1 hypothetical protein [Blastococcus sp. TML/M2B]